MKDLKVSLLRCIWNGTKNHPDNARLESIGDATNGVLRCKGCLATYLVIDEIPVMLPRHELSKNERSLLKKLCNQYGISGS